jgi:hypothetical protein
MDQQEIARQVIRHFKDLQRNPFLRDEGNVSIQLFLHYLHGFHQACRTLGFDPYHPLIEEAVIVEKGLEMNPSTTPVQQLQERGLDTKVIMHELLDIEIQIVRRKFGITDE